MEEMGGAHGEYMFAVSLMRRRGARQSGWSAQCLLKNIESHKRSILAARRSHQVRTTAQNRNTGVMHSCFTAYGNMKLIGIMEIQAIENLICPPREFLCRYIEHNFEGS